MRTIEAISQTVSQGEAMLDRQVERVAPQPVDVTPQGHRLAASWRAVVGATSARVDSSSVTVAPATLADARSLGVVAAARSHVSEIAFTSSVPGALLRAIRIPGLVRIDGEDEFPITSASGLGGDFHLILSPVVGGADQAPIVAVPPLPKRSELPRQLTGGTLTGSLFTVPDVAGSAFKIKLVKRHSPEDFELQTFDHGDVTLYAVPTPVGLHVDDPSGAEQFALGGQLRDALTVDVTAALNRHLGAMAKQGTAIESTITVRSDVIGKASLLWSTSGGVIERAVDGRLTADVSGTPTAVVLAPPHPGRAPTRTVADVTITHHGMAIHPVSDPIPATDAGLGGPTVRDRAVVRALPADALRGQVLRRVCVIGWPRGATDLTLQVLGVTTSVEGLSAPLDRDPPLQVWFDVGEVPVDAPVEIALSATRGAFGWIADPDPLVRLSIAAGPAGERVTVGGRSIDLTGDETVVTAAALSGEDSWAIATDQFCTVSIANAVMEFAP